MSDLQEVAAEYVKLRGAESQPATHAKRRQECIEALQHALGKQGAEAKAIFHHLGKPDAMLAGLNGKAVPGDHPANVAMLPGPAVVPTEQTQLAGMVHDISGVHEARNNPGKISIGVPTEPAPDTLLQDNPRASYFLIYHGENSNQGAFFEVDAQTETVKQSGLIPQLQFVAV
ncbi:hypothetical protein H4R34_003806 [Dimargaris verticillata]|uniref:Uncharacterized protein n=1 Tax=Dimargaris verticillata TaxID=2761393 RepID=A0A9W8B1F5_9FUNG|nr:hypothetical protein H4R34_003806 [Dimargaris verticillata]